MIIRELQQIQHERGYLPQPEMKLLSERLETPLYRLHEVASFFPHFRLEPPAKVRVQVCRDMSCHMAGACALRASLESIESRHGPSAVSVEGASCLGRCDRAPAVLVNDQLFVRRDPESICEIVEQFVAEAPPVADTDRNHPDYEQVDWQIDIYDGQPCYEGVRAYVADPQPQRLIEALETAGLLGMGGAGGRAYKKWNDVLAVYGAQKYVVCNADESEPGTFKDRELLLRTPHLMLEGMILGGLVVGADRGFVYVRHEYPEQIEAVEQAIREAERIGACGEKIFGSSLSFHLETFVSPGGYICGEQTALIEAMEDKRAEPRNRPPELQTNGLWDCPTLLNNVETFAWVPSIACRDQGQWFADQGQDACRGRRLLSVSGDVQRPGVYEVPNGIRFGELLNQYCQGMPEGIKLRAVALSGPSGGLIPAEIPVEHLGSRFVQSLAPGTSNVSVEDLVLDIPTFRSTGLMFGAGIVVYGDQRDLVEEALVSLKFFRNESCGKCVPCRIGSQKLVQLTSNVKAGRMLDSEFQTQKAALQELTETMQITSICGLGMVAANPLHTLMTFFPDEIQRYLT